MDSTQAQTLNLTRRQLLGRSCVGLGSAALASLLCKDLSAAPKLADDPLAPREPHFAAPAKNVIFLHMVGAPSQLELFDHKPYLVKHDGEKMPDALWKDLRLAFVREQPNLLGTRFKFKKHGESGLELSELLPGLGEVADEICLIKSLHTEQFNHAPAQLMMQTGFGLFGRPCFGSWVSYGLGTENENLPSFVVMNTGTIAGAGNSLWGSGFLPSVYQGVEFRSKGDPVFHLSNPKGVDPAMRGRIVGAIQKLNQLQLDEIGDPEISTRIRQYEMAFRMQTAVPELVDTQGESKETHAMYGTQPGKASFANNCLLARRLIERGVRFVQLYDQGWDTHSGVFTNLPKLAKRVDRPIAALIKDLKQRGLLDDTLIVFGAEFGRTPMIQGGAGKGAGRDHHKDAFSIWMAGGGVKGGMAYGETDDLGFHVAKDPMHVNDFHATLLHLLGLDHERLTYRYQGRDFRLTDVAGKVVKKIIA
ncbi:MAG: DUF1501 domain-containing protein [Planctomycetota bacterium]|nr:DUF1501 domain-containing protein [Planctomycetota bacterium]